MKRKLKAILLTTLFILSAVAVTACSGKGTDQTTADNSDQSEAAATEAPAATQAPAATEPVEKTEITIATSGGPKPFTFEDENNELVGYDIEITKAVFAKLPQYEVNFEVTEFTSILAGLDSGLYDLGANNFALNAERQEKYIYSDPIFQNQFVIAVAEDNNDIKFFSDLAGKSTEVNPGVNYTTALEHYNENNPDKQVILNYTESELLPVLQNIESGKSDFNLIDAATLKIFNEEFGVKLKAIALTEEESKLISDSSFSYFLISKSDKAEQLTKDVNAALEEVIADGTVTAISEKYFGADYAPKK